MKGVFCLEGFWYGDHRDSTTVKPVLDLLECYQKLPYVYHRCSTLGEFEFSISRWKVISFHKKYPLLWLAFHGEAGNLIIGKQKVTIQELADILQDSCQGAIIYFASCSTMKWDKRLLQTFMEKTKTLAVMGYKKDIDWLPSASFEIRLLSYFMDIPFTTDGIKQIIVKITEECKSMIADLKFRFEVNERQRFTPKRFKSLK